MRTQQQNGQKQNPQHKNLDLSGDSPITFLRLPQVKAATGLSKTTIYEKIREETFPSPVPIGKRAVGWLQSEIREWAANQVSAGRTGDHTFAGKILPSSTTQGTSLGLRKTA